MTYEEAKNRIYLHGKTMTEAEARIILDALEKQIAKKPVVSKQYELWTDHICPSCGADFEDRTSPYCLACGQKLDWD